MSDEKTPLLQCSFDARWLWPMKKIINNSRKHAPFSFLKGRIGVQPAKEGGVLISVFGTFATAFIHDPDGHATAPMTLDIPDDAFDACKPKQPQRMHWCGEEYDFPLPEWMLPGRAFFHEIFMMVQPKTAPPDWHAETGDDVDFLPALYSSRVGDERVHNVGRDYRVSAGLPADLKQTLSELWLNRWHTDHSFFNPEIPALFSGFLDVMGRNHRGETQETPVMKHFTTRTGPVLVTVANHPEFLGLWQTRHLRSDVEEPREFKRIPSHFMEIGNA